MELEASRKGCGGVDGGKEIENSCNYITISKINKDERVC